MVNWIVIAVIMIGTFFGAAGSLYLKKGAKNFDFNPITQLRNKNLLIGIMLFMLSTVCYLISVKLEKLSIVYPMTSLSYIWVAALSAIFLKEKMGINKYAGIALVIMGIVIASL